MTPRTTSFVSVVAVVATDTGGLSQFIRDVVATLAAVTLSVNPRARATVWPAIETDADASP